MSRSETEYLWHIRDEARYLREASREQSWDDFSDNETLKRAFVRSIEVIGEATKNLSTEFREQHPDVQWRAMAGVRDQTHPRVFRGRLRDCMGGGNREGSEIERGGQQNS